MERTYDEGIQRIDHLLRARTCVQMGCSQNRVNMFEKGFFTNSWRIKIALENFFEEHAQGSLGEKLDLS